jgi:hypothetical protein
MKVSLSRPEQGSQGLKGWLRNVGRRCLAAALAPNIRPNAS